MEKVIDMVPGEAISLDHLGDIYFAMNRKREAIYFWRQAKDLAKPEVENLSLQTLKELAKSKGIYILIGSLPIKLGNKITNRSFLIGPNGKILYKYDKIHLYDVILPNGEIYNESDN